MVFKKSKKSYCLQAAQFKKSKDVAKASVLAYIFETLINFLSGRTKSEIRRLARLYCILDVFNVSDSIDLYLAWFRLCLSYAFFPPKTWH